MLVWPQSNDIICVWVNNNNGLSNLARGSAYDPDDNINRCYLLPLLDSDNCQLAPTSSVKLGRTRDSNHEK